jgi:hypothetical protein
VQNKDDTSTGNPITSLQFDMSSSILLSGERSGMVSYFMAMTWLLVSMYDALHCNKAYFLLFIGPYYHIQKGLQRQHILLFKWYCSHTVPEPNIWCFYLGVLTVACMENYTTAVSILSFKMLIFTSSMCTCSVKIVERETKGY